MIGNRLHRNIGELDRRIGRTRDGLHLQRILEAHQPKTHRAVLEIGAPRLGNGVEIDVEDIITIQEGKIRCRKAKILDKVDIE